MKKILTNNWFLKIISVIAAIIVWLLVVYSLNPVDTKNLRVPVTVINADTLTENNLAYDILGDAYVEIQVTARRLSIGNITEQDFLVEADLKYLQGDEDDYERRCAISQPKVIHNSDIIEDFTVKSDQWIQIMLEDIVTRDFNVQVEPKGSIADGFIVNTDNLVTIPDEVQITGRKSEVDRIYAVRVEVALQDANDEVKAVCTPILYDFAGNVLTDLTTIRVTPEQVEVCVEVYQTKYLDIIYDLVGEPAGGYVIQSVTADITTVKVEGLKAVLSDLTYITVPAERIDVANLTATKQFRISVEDMLPEGVYLSPGEKDTVVITVEVEKKKQNQYRLPLSAFTITGRDTDQYIYSFDAEFIMVEVEGKAEDINNLQIANILVDLDLTGYEPGTYTVEVGISLPVGIDLLSKGNLTVTIELIPPPTEPPTAPPPTEPPTEEVTTAEPTQEETEAPTVSATEATEENTTEEPSGEAPEESKVPEAEE